MGRAPKLPRPGTDWTPGRTAAADNPRIEHSPAELEARRQFGEQLLRQPPQLIAPLSSSARADLMSREDRERFQQAYSSKEANLGPGSFEARLTATGVHAGLWAAKHAPIVAEVIKLNEIGHDLYDVAKSADPVRELGKTAGRHGGGFALGAISAWVGAEVGIAAGAVAGPGAATAGGFALGIAAGEVGERFGERYGERVAAAGVDRYRTWQDDQLPARDELGRFTRLPRMLTTSRVELDSDQINARHVAESLARAPRARDLHRAELLSSSKYDEPFAQMAAPPRPALQVAAYPLAQSAGALPGRTPVLELAGEALRQDSRETEKIVDAIREQTAVLRQMGARPVSSAAYAE